MTEPSHSVRLRTDQESEIREARRFRATAADLRSRVSAGSYGDKELFVFWDLANSAGVLLKASNPELGKRAGLGDKYFSTVALDRRRPKLANFLKALTAIIDLADERLFDVDNAANVSIRMQSNEAMSKLRIEQDQAELFALAHALGRLARGEIEKLDNERPNDPVTVASNAKQRELLLIFATGFERISAALAPLTDSPHEPLLLGKASEAVKSVAAEVNAWWKRNSAEAIDWSVRIPVFTAGVTMLGWAGANMTVATSAVAAIVGGKKVIDSFRNRKKSK